ncbi:MAG: endonuclease [Candidatus Methanoperedens sp.]|nr:endonuclease [Candidatus Methanoperedens sp.]
MKHKEKLTEVYNKLFGKFGNRHWWPADSPFEVVVGAILTQQTKWENVEKAIRNLKDMNLMDAESLSETGVEELEELVRCTGFFRQKSRRLKNISTFFAKHPDILEKHEDELRKTLLSLNGVGEETADSIVLYAAGKPKFVIDAYTKRMCSCLGIKGNYGQLQSIFESSIPKNVSMYKEYHALIVEYGKRFCGKKICSDCILVENGKMQ